MNTMRVLHGPQNISGMAYALAKAQRDIGLGAEAVTVWNPVFRFASDRWLDATGAAPNPVDPKTFMEDEFETYDVYHFYFGLGYTGPDLKEFARLKRLGKRIYMYFCGCDLRDSKKTLQTYRFSVCQECWPQACSPNRAKAMEMCRKYADGVFVSTVDLMDSWPDAIWLPQPVDVMDLQGLACTVRRKKLGRSFTKTNPLLIAHAPSDPKKKGTEYIERAIEAMQADGLHVKLKVISGTSHPEAIRASAKADVAVDQLLAGVYGSYSVEMMAIGTPVIAYLRESWLDRFPERPPLISADPETIEARLREVYSGQIDLATVVEKSRQFMERYHDSEQVARRAIETYESKS